MKIFQIILSAVTTFVITGGGAVGVVMASGSPLNSKVWICSLVLGLVAAAKDTRSLMQLPPLSNGNYEMLKNLYANQKQNDNQTKSP